MTNVADKRVVVETELLLLPLVLGRCQVDTLTRSRLTALLPVIKPRNSTATVGARWKYYSVNIAASPPS